MTAFAVCDSVVSNAARHREYYANILAIFAQENGYQVAVDLPRKEVFSRYASVAASDITWVVALWMILLCDDYVGNFEELEYTSEEPGVEFFIGLAEKCEPERTAIVWSKAGIDKGYMTGDTLILDRTQAKLRFISGEPIVNILANNSTIVYSSLVSNAFNVLKERSVNQQAAFDKIRAFVESSANTEAREIFAEFSNEVAKL